MSVYQQVYFHKLGAPTSQDTYAIGRDFPRIAEVVLESGPGGKVTIARVANGDGGDFALYVHSGPLPGGVWTQLSRYEDRIVNEKLGPDGALYLLSHAKPRGEVLRLSPPTLPLAKATVLVPESDAVIESFVPTRSRLYVVDLVGGPSQVRVIPLAGGPTSKLPLYSATRAIYFRPPGTAGAPRRAFSRRRSSRRRPLSTTPTRRWSGSSARPRTARRSPSASCRRRAQRATAPATPS
jgi:hypothetical protein